MCDLSFLNSNFVTTLLGSLAGAAGGAYAAQHLGDKAKRSDELINEIRCGNLAISLSSGICETYMAFKDQLLKQVLNNFTSEKKRFDELRTQPASLDGVKSQLIIQFDLRSFHTFSPPISNLLELTQGKITPTPRTILMIARMYEIVSIHNHTINERNALILRMRAANVSNDKDGINLYFGLPLTNGSISTEYPDTLGALSDLTDDLIFFSSQVTEDLYKRGGELIKKYKELGGEIPAQATHIDYEHAKSSGLIPSKDKYKDWFEKFKD